MKVINGIRSVIFNLVFYLFSLIFIPTMALMCIPKSETLVRKGIGIYSAVCRFLARVIMGIKIEYRGIENLPEGQVLLLSKHQTYFDPILAFKIRPDVTALAKKELFTTPALGTVMRKANIIRVDRQSRTAHEAMPRAGEEVVASKRALIVYPEATRVAPGKSKKLKSGGFYLQRDHDLPVYPVASNAGMFWTRGFWHRPGTAVYEVGDPFPADLSKEEFMKLAHEKVVKRSDELMVEGGLDPAVVAAAYKADK